MSVRFVATEREHDLVTEIVERAAEIANAASPASFDRQSAAMDLIACHANGWALDFERMAEADNFNVAHHVFGIARHINRETGQLEDCFLPRFAKR